MTAAMQRLNSILGMGLPLPITRCEIINNQFVTNIH